MVYQGKEDQVTVVAAGVTLHEALAAAEHLKKGTELYVLIMRRKKNYICLKSQIGLFLWWENTYSIYFDFLTVSCAQCGDINPYPRLTQDATITLYMPIILNLIM